MKYLVVRQDLSLLKEEPFYSDIVNAHTIGKTEVEYNWQTIIINGANSKYGVTEIFVTVK